jgi:hypothetical protein
MIHRERTIRFAARSCGYSSLCRAKADGCASVCKMSLFLSRIEHSHRVKTKRQGRLADPEATEYFRKGSDSVVVLGRKRDFCGRPKNSDQPKAFPFYGRGDTFFLSDRHANVDYAFASNGRIIGLERSPTELNRGCSAGRISITHAGSAIPSDAAQVRRAAGRSS